MNYTLTINAGMRMLAIGLLSLFFNETYSQLNPKIHIEDNESVEIIINSPYYRDYEMIGDPLCYWIPINIRDGKSFNNYRFKLEDNNFHQDQSGRSSNIALVSIHKLDISSVKNLTINNENCYLKDLLTDLKQIEANQILIKSESELLFFTASSKFENSEIRNLLNDYALIAFYGPSDHPLIKEALISEGASSLNENQKRDDNENDNSLYSIDEQKESEQIAPSDTIKQNDSTRRENIDKGNNTGVISGLSKIKDTINDSFGNLLPKSFASSIYEHCLNMTNNYEDASGSNNYYFFNRIINEDEKEFKGSIFSRISIDTISIIESSNDLQSSKKEDQIKFKNYEINQNQKSLKLTRHEFNNFFQDLVIDDRLIFDDVELRFKNESVYFPDAYCHYKDKNGYDIIIQFKDLSLELRKSKIKYAMYFYEGKEEENSEIKYDNNYREASFYFAQNLTSIFESASINKDEATITVSLPIITSSYLKFEVDDVNYNTPMLQKENLIIKTIFKRTETLQFILDKSHPLDNYPDSIISYLYIDNIMVLKHVGKKIYDIPIIQKKDYKIEFEKKGYYIEPITINKEIFSQSDTLRLDSKILQYNFEFEFDVPKGRYHATNLAVPEILSVNNLSYFDFPYKPKIVNDGWQILSDPVVWDEDFSEININKKRLKLKRKTSIQNFEISLNNDSLLCLIRSNNPVWMPEVFISGEIISSKHETKWIIKAEFPEIPDPEESIVLTLNKPPGYDIWDRNLIASKQEDSPTIKLKLSSEHKSIALDFEKYPDFHLFFVDVSNTNMKGQIVSDILNVLSYEDELPGYFLYITNNSEPIIITKSENYREEIAQSIATLNPYTPNLEENLLVKLPSKLKPIQNKLKRRNLFMHFYLSPNIMIEAPRLINQFEQKYYNETISSNLDNLRKYSIHTTVKQNDFK